MPTVYTKEEADRLFNELRDLFKSARAEFGVDIADIKHKIDSNFNELFGMVSDARNMVTFVIDEQKKDLERQKDISDVQKRLKRVMQK